MPNQPKTPVRTFRVNDEAWARFRQLAAEAGLSPSDVLRRFVEQYDGELGMQEPPPPPEG